MICSHRIWNANHSLISSSTRPLGRALDSPCPMRDCASERQEKWLMSSSLALAHRMSRIAISLRCRCNAPAVRQSWLFTQIRNASSKQPQSSMQFAPHVRDADIVRFSIRTPYGGCSSAMGGIKVYGSVAHASDVSVANSGAVKSILSKLRPQSTIFQCPKRGHGSRQ